MHWLLYLLVAVAALAIAVLALRLIFRLPQRRATPSETRGAQWDTLLGRAIQPQLAAHPGLCAVHLLSQAERAFAMRVALVRAARQTLDLQYYIWHPDVSGLILLEELRCAAERGVRVRLLVDDNGAYGLDRQLASLDAHPNVEVRLINPFPLRWPRTLGYLMDFHRLNRRMHNKSLTVDGVATVVGGRNIGDEYFGVSREGLFDDLDALIAGPVVEEVARSFDLYWNCESAWPLTGIVPPQPAGPIALSAKNSAIAESYGRVLREQMLEDRVARADFDIEWAPGRLMVDDPGKIAGKERRGGKLADHLVKVIGEVETSLGIVSAYFVPTQVGTDFFTGLAARGAQVSVLTNALNSNDVAVVHAGYAKHRKALLRGGVRLWELKGQGKAHLKLLRAGSGSAGSSRGAAGGGGRGSGRARSGPVLKASGSSLHAKTFTIDRRRFFIGSYNFDPRSANLNSEMGVLIESPLLAGQMQDMFDKGGLNEAAWEVRLDDHNHLRWIEHDASGDVVHLKEPRTGPLQRAIVAVLGLLPIDWLL